MSKPTAGMEINLGGGKCLQINFSQLFCLDISYYEKFLPYCVEITDHDIKRACEFRLQNKNKELSYIDCIGYIIAVEKKIKFLTGDEGFRNIGNVEFVK